MFSLIETNVHWKRTHIISSFERTLKEIRPNDKLSTCISESDLSWNTYYTPGGPATISLKTALYIVHKGQDPSGLGRWTFTTILGKQKQRTIMFTIYLPCQIQIESVGESTVIKQ